MIHAFQVSGVAVSPRCRHALDCICARLADHVNITRSEDGARLVMANSSIELTLEARQMLIAISCPNASLLFNMRSMVAEHLHEAAPDDDMEIIWADGPQASSVPDFSEVIVVGARNITPHMRRVTVATERPAHFVGGGLHVRLLIPPQDRRAVWPHVEPDGRICWPKGDDALTIRAYTIRNVDLGRSELDIDFVIHDGGKTPGAAWSLAARPGDRIGLMGPGGGGMPEAEDLLLAGDETALPAIARIAAAAPASARLRIVLEIEDEDDRQPLPSDARCTVTWLHRNGHPGGTTGALMETVRTAIEGNERPTYVWVACEQSEARNIRNFMRSESGYDRGSFSVAAYWQREAVR